MIGSSYLGSGEIEDEILSREWTLNDVLDMDRTVDDIVQKLITGMDISSKYEIIKDVVLPSEITLGELITNQCRLELSDMVQFVVNNYLKTAKVEFNDNNNNSNLDNTKVEQSKRLEENKDEKLLDVPSQDEKIITLKERIRQETKRLDKDDMKEQGMI